MTKSLTLCLLLIGNILWSFSKSDFNIIEFQPSLLKNPSAKLDTKNFRYDGNDYLIVQPKNNSPKYLQDNGVHVHSYLGDGYYLVSTEATQTAQRYQNIAYNKLGYFSSESKIESTLKEQTTVQTVAVLYAASTDDNTITDLCASIGISILQNNKRLHFFTTNINNDQLQKLSHIPFVYFITQYHTEKNILMFESLLMTGANQVQEPLPFGYNLKGEGMNVGVWDMGAVGTNVDLPINKNFVIDKEYSSAAYLSHPTQVGGCIGAEGNLSPRMRGMAPRCNIYYWDVAGDIVNEILEGKSNNEVNISNHSYSFLASNCFQSGMYIPQAADLDKAVYDNPTLLPVVAVGNTASANCAAVTDTFSSVDIGFQGCKNAITVGWLFSDERAVENSGRGPTMDGRLKPELVSKGFSVTALAPNNGTQLVYGSSYSSPQIAGIAALIYQKYKQIYGTLPNASLIKSILFNTARDLGNPGPDYMYGFGKPDVYRAVKSVAENLYFENSISQDEWKLQNITVSNNTYQLKITLSWTDKEGNPIADQAIVNNLDVKIVTPTGDTILPWKLNPQKPRNVAFRGVDNINTNEQITIDNPVTGTYTIIVKGTSVPYGPQDYAVAYYAQERKIEIVHPNGGEILDPGSAQIRWNRNGIDSLARIEYSVNNGTTWQTIITNQNLNTKTYNWQLPGIVSDQCLVRIVSGNNITTSASTFTIGTQVSSIAHTVCDKTIKINWASIGASAIYKIYLFTDSTWTLAGQTNLSSFTINNLVNGKNYMYAVSTVFSGIEGNRSAAKVFSPSATTCTTANDVGVYAMLQPVGGRKFTFSALTSSTKLSFIIKNYGTATQNTINISYRINNGTIKTATLNDVMPANDTSIIKFTINENLSAVGNYTVAAWTSLVGDENIGNDTLVYIIKQLNNAPIVLPKSESFETVNSVSTNNIFGINGADYIDYSTEQGGRCRTNEGDLYANTGMRALTLDNYLGSGRKINEVAFTYNLSNYVDSIIFLDFSYLNRAETDSNNIIFARGDDTKPWVQIFDLYKNRGEIGSYKNVTALNLYQKLKIENGQNFSSSTQLKIVQTATKTATTRFASGGYTFDDLKLYVAGKDVATINIKTQKALCTKTFTAQPISITVFNNSSQTINNLPVSYQVNNNTVVTESINFTIAPNDSATYIFSTKFLNNQPGRYAIKAWASNAGDKYPLNDTAFTSVLVMKTIDAFPYYNDFESNDGNLLTEGTNSSWVWGTPLKYGIDAAAQGNKAWTTGIKTGYNFNEDSYLYMGCMDFSALTKDPIIAFNFINDIQTDSDSSYAEYSTDGNTWKRLGCNRCGLNWYSNYLNTSNWFGLLYPWQVAHIKIPLASLDNPNNFMYRIRLMSDDYLVSEGIGIDDIRIFNDYQEIAPADSAYVQQVSTGNGWIQFYKNGNLVAELNDDNKNLGNISLGFDASLDNHKNFEGKNIFPRNWVIKPSNPIIGNFKVRLYVLNEEYTHYILKEDSINKMGDIAMLRYIGLNTNLEIGDNHVRVYYKYYTPNQIHFYPYQDGYFVEFETDTLGEFYLISTKQDADAAQSVSLVDFSAQRLNDDVYLQWMSTKEINSREFVIQYSFDAINFINIDTLPAGGNSTTHTLYNYLHKLNTTSGVYYYRIKIVDKNNIVSYSLIDSVYFSPTVGVKQNNIGVVSYISANDIIISFKNKLQVPATINVLNVSGQLLFTKKTILQNGENPLGISDFIHWSNGAYFLQIQGEEQNYYSKLIKQ
jgi:hypothetical protein